MDAIYITSFNDPVHCRRLMTGLSHVDLGSAKKIVLNHSSDEFINEYDYLCHEFGWSQFRLPNGGATKAKWNVIEHAYSNGYDIVGQISEDFDVCCNKQLLPWVPTAPSFIQDTAAILDECKHLTFVHWSFITGGGSALVLSPDNRKSHIFLKKCRGSKLAHLEGEVRLLNWPCTYRVKRMHAMLFEVMQELGWSLDKQSKMPDGGESLMAERGYGQGAVLFAYPVHHDRGPNSKPKGSLA